MPKKAESLAPRPRLLVLVDEANVGSSVRTVGRGLDWLRLRDFLGGPESGRELIEMVVYAGLPPAIPLWQEERDKKNKFVHWLRSNGFLVVLKDGAPAEEGHYKANVDVMMAIDALELAREMKPEVVVLVTGDADFAHLTTSLRRRGIRVEVASVAQNLGNVLKASANATIDLAPLFRTFELIQIPASPRRPLVARDLEPPRVGALRFSPLGAPATLATVKKYELVRGFAATLLLFTARLWAQMPAPHQTPDVSDKALITAAKPGLVAAAALHQTADDFYHWRNEQYPVGSSDAGLHTWDNRLTDYSAAAIADRARHVADLLQKVSAMDSAQWPKDQRIDWILFRAQLEGAAFDDRVWHSTSRDPQTYVGECSNAIFSLLKKDYDTPQKRAAAATARLQAMPALLAQGEKNLTEPVKLFAQLAIASARAIDPLFNDSLMSLAKDLAPNEHKFLVEARDSALQAIHGFADHLEKKLPAMVAFTPMGEENYNFYLHHLLLLPLDAAQVEMIGRVELAQYRSYEAWLPDPSLADPDPKRSKNIPPNQAAFLQAYESREAEMIAFLKEHQLVTIPDYLGKFEIRQLPAAFKPTSPGGFMNPPGLYDQDSTGFYFIPTYDRDSQNFYIRAAIEDPRPILGHEGIPGHFLQLSSANHLKDEIRRQNGNNVFIEGWALYGEEMLLREGLYPADSASAGQVLRLARYRCARIGVDVNLHTGKWTFEQAVKYFMEAGGLDREAAEGEAAGAASSPTQKISYIVGKWQIMQLLGSYRDKSGKDFRLGKFHDDLISHGSLPVSILKWIMLDDPSDVEQALAR